jgi:hypothetical protein
MKNLNTKAQNKAQRAISKLVDLSLDQLIDVFNEYATIKANPVKNHVSNLYGNTYTELVLYSDNYSLNFKASRAGFRSAREGSVLKYNPGGSKLSNDDLSMTINTKFKSLVDAIYMTLSEFDKNMVNSLGFEAYGNSNIVKNFNILKAFLFVEHSAIDLPSNFAD